jgi:hypothetical protein
MLSIMLGNELLINSIDEEEEYHGNVPHHQHTSTLPSQLVIKLNMLVEIYACNYDSQDGLVNGADGIVKAYTQKRQSRCMLMVWYISMVFFLLINCIDEKLVAKHNR